MNTIPTTTVLPTNPPSRKTLWLLALSTPLVLAPTWCLAMGGLPASLGTVNGLMLLMLLVSCTVTDLHSRKVYNWATYTAIGWALMLNLATFVFAARFNESLGTIGLQQCLQGVIGCFIVMLFAYSLARGGAGDVKLAAAIGALVGLEQGVVAIGISYILAGATIMLWSIWMQGPLTLAAAMGRLLGSMVLPLWIDRPTSTDKVLLSTPVPLAGFFAVGTLIVVLGIV